VNGSRANKKLNKDDLGIVQGSDASDLVEHSIKDYLLKFGNTFVGGKRKRGSEFAKTRPKTST
jgi:hypothetical protein